ncbi:GWxTD domain-containing protein [bacterium]|nr:GWxTD domain-containing protein [bacterium]MBU1983404.1 GWxTD domain-containing protein [bacterium]
MRDAFLSISCALALLIGTFSLRADYTLDLDCASFRAADSLGYVEVYTAVQQAGLRYKVVGDSLIAEFKVSLDVLQAGNVVLSDTFHALDARTETEPIDGQGSFYPHVFRLIMKPGSYALRAHLLHWDPQPVATAACSLRVPQPTGDLSVSQIELGTELSYTDDGSVFVKHGVRMIPNATGFYGTQIPVLYFYAEAYELDYDSQRADSHVVVRKVLDAETGAPVRPEQTGVRPTTGSSVVIVDGFPTATLRTGTYYLELTVISLRSGRSATMRKKFWTYRAADLAAGRNLQNQPEFGSRLAEVDPNFLEVVNADSAERWMRYILTRDEYRRLRRLTPEGKRQFIREFWEKRERDDPGAGNRYFARIVEANRRYSYLQRPGWKTDRGRVFVLYGEPDRVENNYAMPQTIDHEIWGYDQLEGGVFFVFADRQGFGDLDLVHSTKRGEIYNPNWEQRLRTRDQTLSPSGPFSPGR